MQIQSRTFNASNTKQHKTNRKKCIQILKKGLQLTSTSQQPNSQNHIHLLACLRDRFPSSIPISKIIYRLYQTLVKIQSIDNKIIQFKMNLYGISQNQRSIQEVSVVKCWEKFGMNGKKVNKFFSKAGLKIQLNQQQYSNVLIKVLNNTINIVQNLISNECLLQIDLQMLQLHDKQINFSTIGTSFKWLISQIMENRLLKCEKKDDSQKIVQQTQCTPRETFLTLMKLHYGIITSQQSPKLYSNSIISLYLLICNQLFNNLIPQIQLTKQNLKQIKSNDGAIMEGLRLKIQQDVWVRDGIYLKVAKAVLNHNGEDLFAKVDHAIKLFQVQQINSFKITKLQIVTILKNIIRKVLNSICDSKSNDVQILFKKTDQQSSEINKTCLPALTLELKKSLIKKPYSLQSTSIIVILKQSPFVTKTLNLLTNSLQRLSFKLQPNSPTLIQFKTILSNGLLTQLLTHYISMNK